MKYRTGLLLIGAVLLIFAYSQIRTLIVRSFYSWQETPSAEEIAGYKNYLADEEALRRDGGPGKTLKEIIRSLCVKTGEQEISGQRLITYYSHALKDYIPRHQSFREIYELGELLTVSYIASDGREVTLAFEEDACRCYIVYSEIRDLLYQHDPGSSYGADILWHNFRKGSP